MSGRSGASLASTMEHVDRYAARSSVNAHGIYLAASSSTAAASSAPFFCAYLTSPRRGADLALTVAHVVETRFYTPPGMVERLIRQRDPVITCGQSMLRLEGFSACCGVYARLDLKETAFDAERVEPGTSNVDFNPPMRAALAKLRDGERVRLAVSRSGLELSSSAGTAFERRVELPLRWIKGFVEVQAHQARMERRFAISGAMVRRFLRELPNRRMPGTVNVSPLGGTLRLSQASAATAATGVRAGGIDRLRILAEVARHATALEVYAGADGATGWCLETPDARLFLILSPEPARGFSGEGQVLNALTTPARPAVTSRLRALLRWQSELDPAALAGELQVAEKDVSAALAALGSGGLLGYDLAAGRYFHRELPFDLGRMADTTARMHPRLAAGRELADAGGVEWDGEGAWVRSQGTEYRVRRDAGGGWRCVCPWAAKHGSSRGPCKHILAARIAAGLEVDHDID